MNAIRDWVANGLQVFNWATIALSTVWLVATVLESRHDWAAKGTKEKRFTVANLLFSFGILVLSTLVLIGSNAVGEKSDAKIGILTKEIEASTKPIQISDIATLAEPFLRFSNLNIKVTCVDDPDARYTAAIIAGEFAAAQKFNVSRLPMIPFSIANSQRRGIEFFPYQIHDVDVVGQKVGWQSLLGLRPDDPSRVMAEEFLQRGIPATRSSGYGILGFDDRNIATNTIVLCVWRKPSSDESRKMLMRLERTLIHEALNYPKIQKANSDPIQIKELSERAREIDQELSIGATNVVRATMIME